MKAILTLIFVTAFGAAALAQNVENHDEIQSIEMGVVLDSGANSTDTYQEIKTVNENQVARLYKFKNSKIKNALDFTTKRDKAKLV